MSSKHEAQPQPANEPDSPERRGFMATASSLFMAGGLAAGYGAFAALSGRYLYPAQPEQKAWVYAADARSLQPGSSFTFRTPMGATVAIARQGGSGNVDDFIALSSTCPHLGCQVHWEGQNNRFFCPCHNGVFDPKGKGIGGPPGDAGQSLPQYPLKLENGLLFIEVPLPASGNSHAAAAQDSSQEEPS